MKVEIWRERTSKPIEYSTAEDCYQKQDFYCVVYWNGDQKLVDKYPLQHLFRVTEEMV